MKCEAHPLDTANNAPAGDRSEQSRMADRYKSNSRQGFTLIELLVVIGIIGILTAIAIVGFGAMQRSAANKKTGTMLANAASMLAEYDTATALRRQPGYMWDMSNSAYPTAGFDIWRDADPTVLLQQRPKALRSLDTDSPDRDAALVRNTAVVMAEMLKTPGVKKMFTQLPAESTAAVAGEPVSPVLLDGWGNPIVFVPASGLDVVLGDPAAAYVITSGKTYPILDLPPGTLAPNARPFFASAGPDGILCYGDVNANDTYNPGTDLPGGDDNVYSFEN